MPVFKDCSCWMEDSTFPSCFLTWDQMPLTTSVADITTSVADTTTATTTQPTPGAGCSDNLMFSTSSNSYTDGKLTCYDDKGLEIEKEKMEKVEKEEKEEKEEDELLSPGTTCTFLSSGHVSTGGFAIEMFCRDSHWQVSLTQL